MKTRTFGRTGLQVTPLGLGTAQIGYLGLSQADCDRLLGGALDLGINLIDTAASYMDSEEKIGRALSARRDRFILSTKCGQKVDADDPAEWTGKIVRKSAQRSLKRLATDHLDILLLHSCPLANLRDGDLIDGLRRCKADGLTRFVGYSGDNEAAREAANMDVFDCLEMSLNICDQGAIDTALREAEGKAILVKRSIANACWRDPSEFSPFYESYVQPYVRRLKEMAFTPQSLGFDGDWGELALRFTAWQPGVHCALIGGTNLDHIRANIAAVEKGPLPEPVAEGLRKAWRAHAVTGWAGQT
ncbi:MAG: aldo/keto reductase [Candidatus Sumerlaeia bacterium]